MDNSTMNLPLSAHFSFDYPSGPTYAPKFAPQKRKSDDKYDPFDGFLPGILDDDSNPLLISPPSPNSSNESSGSGSPHLNDVDAGFASLLDQMKKLQRYSKQINNGERNGNSDSMGMAFSSHSHSDDAKNQDIILVGIETASNVLCSVLRSQMLARSVASMAFTEQLSPGGFGLVALAIATALKISDVCHLVLLQSKGLNKQTQQQSSPPSSFDFLLLFKRVDVHVMQVRIALSYIIKLEPSFGALAGEANDRLREMEQKFRALVEEESTW
jgi:hypothetical protein